MNNTPSMPGPGADELRTRRWLRGRGVGPDAHPNPTPPAEEEEPAPDWWDHLYPDQDPAEPDEDEPDDEDDRPWWSLHRRPGPAEPPQQPQPQVVQDATGVHITINQGPTTAPAAPSTADHQRARRIRWLTYHGTAATVGWALGLESAMAAFMDSTGHRAPAVGIGLCLIAAIPAVWFPGLPYIPPPLRPATVWLSRIPVATAVLALALHTPGTL